MKKALILVVLIVTPMVAFAQATVGFINNSNGLVRRWSPADGSLIPVPVGGAHVELLVAAAGMSFTPLGRVTPEGFYPAFQTLAGFLVANPGWETIATTGITPVAGRFNGGGQTLPGIAGGASAEYIIIGWTGPFTSYDAAFAGGGLVSSSALATTLTGNAGATPPGIAVPLSATFTGIIFGIPEPTTIALAGLGVVMLMIFRRHR